MGFWLLVFFLTPIVEMYLLIEVGGYLGALPTIALVMLTAVIGVALLRVQGLATLTRGMSRLEGGELPAREMAEGILLAVAGALLLTPGFVTDGIGFLLLFPPTRAVAAKWMLSRVEVRMTGSPGVGADSSPRTGFGGEFRSRPGFGSRSRERSYQGASRRGTTIEGEFESRTEGDEASRDDDDSSHRLP